VLLGTERAIYLVRANGWSESAAALLGVLRNVGLILFAWSALSRSGLLRKLTPAESKSYWQLVLLLFVKLIVPLAMLTLLFFAVAYAIGYQALSLWVVQSAGWTAVLIMAVGLLYRAFRQRLHAAVSFMRDEQSADGAGITPWWIGLERILGGALKVLLGIGAYFVLLSIWDISAGDVSAILQRPMFGADGQTWGMALGGLLKAAIVLLLLALIRNLLIFFIFPRADVEAGARYAMLTVLRYGAVVLVVLFLLGAFGIDTSSLAIFAGAATFGLAFGMRDIFSNFFSGLIMLVERPVRLGDTVEVGSMKGKVEAIRLRTTTIRTFDGTSVIVPNTHLIGERLTNHSHGLTTPRMQIDVGVSYDSDPRDVEKILLEVAHSDPRVIADPAPVVRFQSFGESSLDFTLRVWTHTVDERWDMVHVLRVKIFEALKEAGIEIPFPQRDLHIRSDATKEA
jgi:small-conductance mechanosensitive channel